MQGQRRVYKGIQGFRRVYKSIQGFGKALLWDIWMTVWLEVYMLAYHELHPSDINQ